MDTLARLADQVEQVSQIYASRHGIARDDDWFVLKLQEELGELTQSYLGFTSRSRRTENPDDARAAMAAEVADLICHALLFARRHRLDLDGAIERKWLTHLQG